MRSCVTVRCMFVFVDVHCKVLREVAYIAFFIFVFNQSDTSRPNTQSFGNEDCFVSANISRQLAVAFLYKGLGAWLPELWLAPFHPLKCRCAALYSCPWTSWTGQVR